jgi:hypothetical protein
VLDVEVERAVGVEDERIAVADREAVKLVGDLKPSSSYMISNRAATGGSSSALKCST